MSHYEDSHDKMLRRVNAFHIIDVCTWILCRGRGEIPKLDFFFILEEKLTYTYFVKPKDEVIFGNGCDYVQWHVLP